MGIGRLVPAKLAQERKHMLIHDREHLCRSEVLEARPAQILVRAVSRIVALGKNASLDRPLEPGRLVLFERLQIVEAPEE